MIDERELREMLERRAGTISATPADAPKAVRRARRRLVLNAAVGTVVGLVVLVGAFAGVRAIQTAAPIPADPPVEPRPAPAPAPAASGTLAYVLDGDIYLADPDGSNAARIADGRPAEDCAVIGEYWAEGPMWSPDGRYLAYRYSDCSNSELFGGVVISDAEGNVLATFPSDGWKIAWSPDSTRVAVWDSLWETIGVYGLDGARQTQLTMPPGWGPSGDHDPEWMPDGTSVMVNNVVVPLDGGTPRQLPWGPDAYSPDGSHVAYVDHGSLVVAEADGSNPQEVFGARPGDLVWAPTGDRIAFTSANRTELSLLDVATGTVTLLTETDGSDMLSVMVGAAFEFSPEGDRILFSRTEDEGAGVSSLWIINADGSDLRRLITGTAWGDWLSPSQTA